MSLPHKQGSWSGSLSSVPPIRSVPSAFLPFAAHFASSTYNLGASSFTSVFNQGTTLDPELEVVFARMRKHIETGKWEPEDSQALLSLLDDGWYSKNNNKKTPRPSTAPTTGTTAASSLNDNNNNNHQQIPAIRPLDLASLREHTINNNTNTPLTAVNSGVMFSARSNAISEQQNWAGLDTPRSWMTAASVAASLPQSAQEMDAMDIDEVQQLVEDADVLQQRAAMALKLAQAKLKKNHSRRHHHLMSLINSAHTNASWVFYFALQIGLMVMAAVVDAALIIVDALVHLVAGQQRTNDTSTNIKNVYSIVGAVAGVAQGIVLSVLGTTAENV